MNTITMKIHDIKGFNDGTIELPIENDIYAIVGNNGSGKSTIMSCLAQLISRHNLGMLRNEDHCSDSYVKFTYDGKQDVWTCNKNGFWVSSLYPDTITFNGTYEGSLFYGQRFRDSKNVDELMEKGKISEDSIVDADEYIVNKLGEILHGNPLYYKGLKKIKNKKIALDLKLKNTPYFSVSKSGLISQYRMSSGECLLISLLHFIYNSIIRRSLPADSPIIMIIDEIELALHPVAITKLLDLLKELVSDYDNLTVFITSHSPEVIRKIAPNNIYKIERVDSDSNNFEIVNPCYPSYAIRDVYEHDGFDYLLLVEDELAKRFVKQSINDLSLNTSRLISVVPVGGWQNVLSLQYELVTNNVLGVGKKVISVLDGDVQSKCQSEKKYKASVKLFLPIQSIEKYLKDKLIDNPDSTIKKKINDTFFSVSSLDSIISEYRINEKKEKDIRGEEYKEDKDGKRFYQKWIIPTLAKYKISENEFIDELFSIIKSDVDMTIFNNNLQRLM
ncbi:MAG: ATP-binding cassette domain-containing protein [Ruminococcus albus]|nr:ATP-binding cassette domain-containing protein [Ruminococcus albus]